MRSQTQTGPAPGHLHTEGRPRRNQPTHIWASGSSPQTVAQGCLVLSHLAVVPTNTRTLPGQGMPNKRTVPIGAPHPQGAAVHHLPLGRTTQHSPRPPTTPCQEHRCCFPRPFHSPTNHCCGKAGESPHMTRPESGPHPPQYVLVFTDTWHKSPSLGTNPRSLLMPTPIPATRVVTPGSRAGQTGGSGTHHKLLAVLCTCHRNERRLFHHEEIQHSHLTTPWQERSVNELNKVRDSPESHVRPAQHREGSPSGHSHPQTFLSEHSLPHPPWQS